MAVEAEHDRLGADPAQGHINTELFLLAPEPAAIDLRPVARDEHHFAQLIRVCVCGDRACAFARLVVERPPAPTVTCIDQASAVARRYRAVFDVDQLHPGLELILSRARFDHHLAVNAAATDL